MKAAFVATQRRRGIEVRAGQTKLSPGACRGFFCARHLWQAADCLDHSRVTGDLRHMADAGACAELIKFQGLARFTGLTSSRVLVAPGLVHDTPAGATPVSSAAK